MYYLDPRVVSLSNRDDLNWTYLLYCTVMILQVTVGDESAFLEDDDLTDDDDDDDDEE